MTMNNGERKLDYQALAQMKDKAEKISKKQVKKDRSSSLDSRDADTEESYSEHGELPDFEEEKTDKNENSQTQFSTQRRVCLVGSLLLCVFTIFAFAFILPCHHQSCAKDKDCGNKPLKHWNKNFTGMVPLVLREFNGGKIYSQGNLLVGFSKSTPGSRNSSCPGRRCHQGILSIKGCNGRPLWNSGINGILGKVVCINHGDKKNHFQAGCFVQEGKNKIIFIDTVNGNKKWKAEKLGDVESFGTIRDINGDSFQDVLLLNGSPKLRLDQEKRDYDGTRKSTLRVLSGKSGKLIGISVPLSHTLRSIDRIFLRVLHLSAMIQFVLIGIKADTAKTGTLLAIEVQDLSNRIYNTSIARRKTPWGSNRPNEFGFIELFKDSLVLSPPLFADLNNDGVEDVVLCTLDKGVTVKALNGQNAVEIWSRRLTSGETESALSAIVSIGNHLIDIAIMIKLSNQSSRIVVLNGRNGSTRWLFTLTNPLPIPPVGVPKAEGIPEGLLLWLPKSKVNKYLKSRDQRLYNVDDKAVEKKPKENEKEKRNRDGTRRRRDLSDVDEDLIIDDVVNELLDIMGEDEETRHDGEKPRVKDKEHEDDVDDILTADVDDDDDDDDNHHGNSNDDDDSTGARDNSNGSDDDDDSTGARDNSNGSDDDDDSAANHGVDDTGGKNVDDDNDNGDDDAGGRKDLNNDDDHDKINDNLDEEDDHNEDPKDVAKRIVHDEKNDKSTHVVSDFNNLGKHQKVQHTSSDHDKEDRRTKVIIVHKSPQENKQNQNNLVDHRSLIKKPADQIKSSKTSDQTSEQTRSINDDVLKNFLRNLKMKDNLQQEQLQTNNPSTVLPTPSTVFEALSDSPATKEESWKKSKEIQSTSSKIPSAGIRQTVEVNNTKREFSTGKQGDKSLFLACDKGTEDLAKILVVVLVYKDAKQGRLRMKEITEDGIINLGPHEFKKQFGQPPPTADCQHFIPNIKSKPIVKDIDGDGRLDLIYALEYINSIAPKSMQDKYRKERFMKIRKLDLLDAMLKRKSKRSKYSYDDSKNSKRNERFESPFAQWGQE